MSYYLQAFICKQIDANSFTGNFNSASKVALGQGLALIPMTNELFQQINLAIVSNPVDRFEYLTENIESEILKIIGNAKFAYVEAEYFGGRGGQIAIIWENKKRVALLQHGKERINQVLKDFGVVTLQGVDEFSTLDFDRHRKTSQWVGDKIF
jgi:hypothetical protein